MPAPLDEQIKRKVIQEWFSGFPRDKIAAENNIGAGSVTSIVSNYKVGLETLDFDSIRQLSIEIKKQGMNWSDLASHFRLYNFFRESEIPEEEIEAFIDKVHHSGIPKEKVIQYVNQLYDISKEQSTPLNEVPTYIKQRLEEKQKIDQEIKDANDILQNKTVTIEAINEHIQLKEELDKHGISIQDTETEESSVKCKGKWI
jgi:hypothetical protein